MKPYATMTEGEKWAWHSEVYAFRRITLDVPADVVVSPCDSEGKWYNETMIRAAAERIRNKRNAARLARERIRGEALAREGRAILGRWAEAHGFANWDEAFAAGVKFSDVITTAAKPMPRERYTANRYGVTATEFDPSPDRMTRDREALGII